MDGDLEVRPDLRIPEGELVETASRSGGPGGQHANKTSSRVTLRWSVRTSAVLNESLRARLLAKLASRLTDDGDLIVNVDDSRSQWDNRRVARERLAEVVREALKVKKRRVATTPGPAADRRRIEAKKRKSATKRTRGRPDDE